MCLLHQTGFVGQSDVARQSLVVPSSVFYVAPRRTAYHFDRNSNEREVYAQKSRTGGPTVDSAVRTGGDMSMRQTRVLRQLAVQMTNESTVVTTDVGSLCSTLL